VGLGNGRRFRCGSILSGASLAALSQHGSKYYLVRKHGYYNCVDSMPCISENVIADKKLITLILQNFLLLVANTHFTWKTCPEILRRIHHHFIEFGIGQIKSVKIKCLILLKWWYHIRHIPRAETVRRRGSRGWTENVPDGKVCVNGL
jgi:hypothetical protein